MALLDRIPASNLASPRLRKPGGPSALTVPKAVNAYSTEPTSTAGKALPGKPLAGTALPAIPREQHKAIRAVVVCEKRPERSDFVKKLHERLTYQKANQNASLAAIDREDVRIPATSFARPFPTQSVEMLATSQNNKGALNAKARPTRATSLLRLT